MKRCLACFFTISMMFGNTLLVGAESDNEKSLPRVFANDLKYTPSYAYLVAVMRPARMVKLDGVQDLPGADLAGTNPMKPSEIERVVVSLYPKHS